MELIQTKKKFALFEVVRTKKRKNASPYGGMVKEIYFKKESENGFRPYFMVSNAQTDEELVEALKRWCLKHELIFTDIEKVIF